jgi:hypothetical protein
MKAKEVLNKPQVMPSSQVNVTSDGSPLLKGISGTIQAARDIAVAYEAREEQSVQLSAPFGQQLKAQGNHG